MDCCAGGFVLSTSADSLDQGVLYFTTPKHDILKYFETFPFLDCFLELDGKKAPTILLFTLFQILEVFKQLEGSEGY